MITIFESSVQLSASPKDVFAFHQNPKNISYIAPSSLRILKVDAGERAIVGEKFTLLLSQFGLRLQWIGVWEAVEEDRLLVDTAEKSPFVFWRHSHIFHPSESGSTMTDRIEYTMPWGALGRTLAPLVRTLVFGPMFRARHAATRAFFARAEKPTRE